MSYERFFARHTGWNENFKSALLYDNPALTLNLRTPETADSDYFGELMENHSAAVYKLTVREIYNGGYVNIEDFIQSTGIPITQRKLTGLRGLYDTAVIKHSKDQTLQLRR